MYYNYIIYIDVTLQQLAVSTGYLPCIVAMCIDKYLPAELGDHIVLNQIKDALQLALPAYIPVRRYLTSPSTSDDDE
jgi:hypothetical protein